MLMKEIREPLRTCEKYETQVFKELKCWRSSISYLNQLKGFFGEYRLTEHSCIDRRLSANEKARENHQPLIASLKYSKDA